MVIAVFVTPHGLGHAARACAVMQALAALGEVRFVVFTTVPEWFFSTSVQAPICYHRYHVDVGFVQEDALNEDLEATVRALAMLMPFPARFVDELASIVTKLSCQAVLCDIAPLGLEVARAAGIPGVLLENFTWDWIYEAYTRCCPELAQYAKLMAQTFATATLHIQAAPLCVPVPRARQVGPVFRLSSTPAGEIRSSLGIGGSTPLVLLTMGGVGFTLPWLDTLARRTDAVFVVVGAGEQRRQGSLVLLPSMTSYAHTDLMCASQVVVMKLGYSSVAELCQSGAQLLYVSRQRFPEAPVLARFAMTKLGGRELPLPDFISGDWLDLLPEVIAAGQRRPCHETSAGAEQAAALISELVGTAGPREDRREEPRQTHRLD